MTDNIQVYVLLNKESCLSDLKLLEFLKAQDLDLDVKIVSDSLDPGTSLIRGDLSIKDAIALNQTEVESRCVVLIPSTAQDFSDVIPFIDKKAYWPNNIIAIDQSISLLLRCESFPQNATIAAPTSGTGDWEPQMKERIVNRTLQRDVLFWTVSKGTPELLEALSTLFSEALKSRLSINFPGRASLAEPDPQSPPPLTLKQIIAGVQSAPELIAETMEYAIWIAGEGYIDTANIVIEALCVHYPNDFPKQRTPCAWGFEFLWHKSRRRPAYIEPFWGAPPDDATLWAAYSDIQQPYPQTNVEKARALVVTDAKILVGNLNFHTYNVNICAEVALEMGMKAKAEDYFDHSIRLLQAEGNPVSLWTELMRSFPLADMILSGRARKITGTTPEEAIQRAKTIVQEIEQWRSTHAKRVAAARDRRAHLRALPLKDLLNQIGKDLRKDPASQSDIEAAEERLKITLPASYTEFLLFSNGMDFIPSINMPGLRSVTELKWESAEDLGLDELPVDLGLATPSLEDSAMEVPKLGRVLMISQEADDEYLWLLEPSQVENAWNVLRQDGVKASGWRVALWRDWQVNIGWYEDFRDYLASVAQRR